MSDSRFMDQMEENVSFSLLYPYHIQFDKLLGNLCFNSRYPDSYHKHDFESVLHDAYMEPKAFYLTDEDKKYYSEQEIEFINKVIADESKKIDDGMVIVNLELDEDVISMIDSYRAEHRLTFEQAIVQILEKIVYENKTNTDEDNS